MGSGGLAVIIFPTSSGPPVRIQKNLVTIKEMALFRLVGASGPPGINLAVFQSLEPYVPIVGGAVDCWVENNCLVGVGAVGFFEEQQIETDGIGTKDREIDPILLAGGTNGECFSRIGLVFR